MRRTMKNRHSFFNSLSLTFSEVYRYLTHPYFQLPSVRGKAQGGGVMPITLRFLDRWVGSGHVKGLEPVPLSRMPTENRICLCERQRSASKRPQHADPNALRSKGRGQLGAADTAVFCHNQEDWTAFIVSGKQSAPCLGEDVPRLLSAARCKSSSEIDPSEGWFGPTPLVCPGTVCRDAQDSLQIAFLNRQREYNSGILHALHFCAIINIF